MSDPNLTHSSDQAYLMTNAQAQPAQPAQELEPSREDQIVSAIREMHARLTDIESVLKNLARGRNIPL